MRVGPHLLCYDSRSVVVLVLHSKENYLCSDFWFICSDIVLSEGSRIATYLAGVDGSCEPSPNFISPFFSGHYTTGFQGIPTSQN